MDMVENIFHKRKIVYSKLITYGFLKEGHEYVFKKKLSQSGLIMSVVILDTGQITAQVIDPSTNEPYTLHLTYQAKGEFVHQVRTEYQEVLMDIADQCSEMDVFHAPITKSIIDYVNQKYGNELEFLWKKVSDNAIWRRSDNQKWYAALMIVSKRKLRIDSDELVEIIDLRETPEVIENLIDYQHYYPGWHMNKKHWYTILLDGSVYFEDICHRIDRSYDLTQKSK